MFDPFREANNSVYDARFGNLHDCGQNEFFKWFIESKLWDKISTEGNDLSQLMALHPEHKYKKQLQRNSRHKSPLLNLRVPTF
jgi:hypothetical protein